MLKILITVITVFTILISSLVANAKMSEGQDAPKFDSSQFQKVGDITLPSKVELPTVFKIDKEKTTGNNRDGLVVVDQNNKPVEMFTRFENSEDKTLQTTIKALSPTKQFEGFANDGLPNTYTEYDLDKDNGKASIELDFRITKNLGGLFFNFANGTLKPDKIEVLGENLNQKFTVIAKTDFTGNYDIFSGAFPPIKVDKVTVNLFHSQILRLAEIMPEFSWGVSKEQAQNELYFLSIPNNQYKVFIVQNNRFPQGWKTLDLNLGYTITEATAAELKPNPEFVNKDTDSDGIKDSQDNCPKVSNPDQIDKDKNGIGDPCEDRDLDSVIDAKDNCLLVANLDQLDSDADKVGDACDSLDNRFLETNTWIVPVVITIASILVIAVFARRLKKIGD